MATQSSTLAWEIPRTQEPGGLQSMGSQESDTTYQQQPAQSTCFSAQRIPLPEDAGHPRRWDVRGTAGRPTFLRAAFPAAGETHHGHTHPTSRHKSHPLSETKRRWRTSGALTPPLTLFQSPGDDAGPVEADTRAPKGGVGQRDAGFSKAAVYWRWLP